MVCSKSHFRSQGWHREDLRRHGSVSRVRMRERMREVVGVRSGFPWMWMESSRRCKSSRLAGGACRWGKRAKARGLSRRLWFGCADWVGYQSACLGATTPSARLDPRWREKERKETSK